MTIESPLVGVGERVDELLYRWDELRRRPVVVLTLVMVAAAFLFIGWLATRTTDGEVGAPVDDRIPVVSLAPATTAITRPSPLLVHVAGAVRSPGVYTLAEGDRILDALAAAGGATPEGQPDRLNLAAPVQDGMRVLVPVEGEAVAALSDGAGVSTAGPVNLNRASAAELETLPGVGPATAAAIISYRDEVGAFQSVSDLLGVRGIGEAKLAAISDLVEV